MLNKYWKIIKKRNDEYLDLRSTGLNHSACMDVLRGNISREDALGGMDMDSESNFCAGDPHDPDLQCSCHGSNACDDCIPF